MRTLRLLPVLCLGVLVLFACETLDFTEDEDTDTETSDQSSASTDEGDTDSDDDYVSDTAGFRGYGALEVYLKHYGTDSLHCIPLVDLLEGGCLYEAYYESTDNQTTLAASARWVGAAVIVGYVSGSKLTANTATFSADGAGQSNILLGPTAESTDYTLCLPVQLSTSSNAMQAVRDACNLSDNPDVLGRNAKFYGKVQTYFGVIGLKSTSDYTFTNDTVLDWETALSDTIDTEDSSTEDSEEADSDEEDEEADEDEDASDDGDGETSDEEDEDEDEADDESDDSGDSSDDEDSSSETNDTSDSDDDDASDSWRGYGSIEAYMAVYGNSYDVPIPLEDCIAGGCLYEYCTTDEDAGFDNNVWVGPGYIVGYLNRSISSCYFTADDAVPTNVLIASSPTTTDPALCMPISLETGSSYIAVREAYNLEDNPDSLGVYVVFRGNLGIKYGTLSLIRVKEAISLPSPAQTPFRRRKEK